MSLISPFKATSSLKVGQPPDSPCETVVSLPNESFDESSRHDQIPWPSTVGYFENILLDENVGIEFHGLLTIWRVCLGFVGALDIVAYLLPLTVKLNTSVHEHRSTNPYSYAKDTFPSIVVDATIVLDRHTGVISILFSSLWFVDAFVTAQARRAKFLQHEERSRYLSCSDVPPEKETKKWWQNASFVYYNSVILQLLLLPVGFYYLLFYSINHLVREMVIDDRDRIYKSTIFTVPNADSDINYEQFSTNTKVSVLFVIVHHLFLKISDSSSRILKAKMSTLMRRFRPTAIKELLGRAIRNPYKLRRDIQSIQTALRWIKFIAPLIGTLNKLKANVDDMLMKQRQRIIALKQKRIRQLLWDEKPTRRCKKEAASIIQTSFRAYKVRKETNSLMSILLDKKCLAAIKVQRALRNSLVRARRRLQKKKRELRRLSEKRTRKGSSLDSEEKRRFYQLQDELAQEAQKLINRRLLLRPNTRFSVLWKVVFIICILCEVSELMATPWLDSYKRQRKDRPMTMTEFVAITFTPTRASQRRECSLPQGHWRFRWPGGFHKRHQTDAAAKDDFPWYCTNPGLAIQEAYSDMISLMLVPAPVSDWPDCRDTKPKYWPKKVTESKRWYCHEPYRSAHRGYRRIFDFLLEEFMLVVSIVCFLDVFIVFFTGEIDEVTGELLPKEFVARWIVPGLVLQLLVNPRLCFLATFLKGLKTTVVKVGLVRVFRWSVASVFPVLYFLWISIIEHIWIPLVQHENRLKGFVDKLNQ